MKPILEITVKSVSRWGAIASVVSVVMIGSAEAKPADITTNAEAKSWAPMVAQIDLRKPASTGRDVPYSLQRRNVPPSNGGVVFGSNGCPEGSSLIIWDAPVYDEEGLFVVDSEPTPVCIPDDLEPEG